MILRKAMMNFLLVQIFLFAGIQASFAGNDSNNLVEKVNAAVGRRYSPQKIEVTNLGNGNVELKGTVNSLYDKLRIFEITSHVNGVRKISNDIAVDTKTLPSEMIEVDIRQAINRNSVIKEPKKIDIAVDNGLVMLSGTVSFYREKLEAATIASAEKGVKGLSNNIKVLPITKAMSDANLENVLMSTLKDEFPLTDPEKVHIKVKDGFATVTGTVSDLWTKRNITDEFSSVLGIIDVINKLEVNPDMNS